MPDIDINLKLTVCRSKNKQLDLLIPFLILALTRDFAETRNIKCCVI